MEHGQVHVDPEAGGPPQRRGVLRVFAGRGASGHGLVRHPGHRVGSPQGHHLTGAGVNIHLSFTPLGSGERFVSEQASH